MRADVVKGKHLSQFSKTFFCNTSPFPFSSVFQNSKQKALELFSSLLWYHCFFFDTLETRTNALPLMHPCSLPTELHLGNSSGINSRKADQTDSQYTLSLVSGMWWLGALMIMMTNQFLQSYDG